MLDGRIPRPALALLALLPACSSPGSEQIAPPEPVRSHPNVLVILTDDQGYGDLGAHGNPTISTPHLDQLWAESTRLTDFHVDPTCSPTRSALMTGRYSTRTGVWHTIMGRSLLDPDEVTLAERFRASGYRTGMFGKWHLGDNWPLRPQDQGFDHVVWHRGGGVGQGPDHWGNDYFDDTYEVNGESRAFEGYCTDVWFDEALDFIERDDERPFFAYLSTNAPHSPFKVDDAFVEPYRAAGVPETMARFYGMITSIDGNVGRLRARLTELGLARDTMLVFLTDNGTAAGHRGRDGEVGSWRGFNAGMRGNKGSEYDGGHRVPCLFAWPGGGIGGGRDVAALTAHVDLLPTLAELCELQPAEGGGRPLDGSSLAAALLGGGPAPTERTLFVHSQRVEYPQKWRRCVAMRGRWRLINGAELYDVRADPGQAQDLAFQHPDLAAELRVAYERWWSSLEPVFEDYVRIGLGGPEDPVRLMSHDWHTGDRGVPWHQSHVRNGYVANGPWAVDVARAGDYEIALQRWPHYLQRSMDVVQAEVEIAGLRETLKVQPVATSARFVVRLPAGPTELKTLLRRADGTEHGAYFASVRWLGSGSAASRADS
ncbi:MAG: arylsulfatase [Planctomycetota bacterium]